MISARQYYSQQNPRNTEPYISTYFQGVPIISGELLEVTYFPVRQSSFGNDDQNH